MHRRLIGPVAALLLLALVLTLAEKRRHRAQLTAEEAQADAQASVVRLRDAVVGHERAAIVVVFGVVLFGYVLWKASRASEEEGRATAPANTDPGVNIRL
jgi:hypothetical protein